MQPIFVPSGAERCRFFNAKLHPYGVMNTCRCPVSVYVALVLFLLIPPLVGIISSSIYDIAQRFEVCRKYIQCKTQFWRTSYSEDTSVIFYNWSTSITEVHVELKSTWNWSTRVTEPSLGGVRITEPSIGGVRNNLLQARHHAARAHDQSINHQPINQSMGRKEIASSLKAGALAYFLCLQHWLTTAVTAWHRLSSSCSEGGSVLVSHFVPENCI